MTNKSVPFFNYPDVYLSDKASYDAIFFDVGTRGAFIEQKEVRGFEKSLAQFSGARFAIGVANATDGLTVIFRCLGMKPGDEVIFCSHTFVATASSAYFAGAKLVPVECGKDHLIDPDAVERAITEKTKFLVPTQLNGRTCDMDRLQQIATKYQLTLVEDAAQGLGSKYKGKDAGTFGAASVISFYPAKNLGCLGDGGAILTNDEGLYQQMKVMRDHGRNAAGEVEVWGINSRLDNLQAAFLSHKLEKYPQIIAHRRHLAGLYQEGLGGMRQLTLPPPPTNDSTHFDVFQNYEIEAENRDGLKAHLQAHGVGTMIQWSGKAVHQFKGLGFNVSLPYTESLFTRMLMLPMNNSLKDEDVNYVCEKVRQFYGKPQ